MDILLALMPSRPRVVHMICNCLVSWLTYDMKLLGIIVSAFASRNVLGLEMNEILVKPLYGNYLN